MRIQGKHIRFSRVSKTLLVVLLVVCMAFVSTTGIVFASGDDCPHASDSGNCSCGPGCKECAEEDCGCVRDGKCGCDQIEASSGGTGDNTDTSGDTASGGSDGSDSIALLSQSLLEKLSKLGIKYTARDVVMIIEEPDNGLMWLEEGDNRSGLAHIMEKHGSQFASLGYDTQDSVVELLYRVLEANVLTDEEVSNSLLEPAGVYSYGGHDWLVTYGTNGYIVSFYPYS